MAKKDDSQASRVYKTSDVHKRRIGRKAHSDEAAPASAQPPSEGVVLTPEFGRRTERQKEADDRWFAAMRDEISEAAPSLESQATPLENAATHDERGMGEAPRDAAAPDAPGMGEKSDGGAFCAPVEHDVTADQSQGQPESGFDSQPTGEIAPVPETLDAPPQGDGLSEERPEPRAPKPLARMAAGASVRKRVITVVATVVIILVAVAVALFTWNRWYRFDDHADLQGEWYVAGTTTPVVIGEETITLTDDVAYRYEVNPQDKTIRYTFGPMEGQGRYWFSDDRQYLVITDGDDYTSASTAVDDLLHEFSDLMDRAAGSGIQLPEGEGIIAFSRTPDAKALAREQAEAAARAAEEEAARKAAEEEAARQAAEEAADWEGYYYEEEAPAEEAPAEGEAPAEEAPAEGQSDEGEY